MPSCALSGMIHLAHLPMETEAIGLSSKLLTAASIPERILVFERLHWYYPPHWASKRLGGFGPWE